MKIWHTKTLISFKNRKFDKKLDKSNIVSKEISIKEDYSGSQGIIGYAFSKKHASEDFIKTYFLKTSIAKKLPIEVLNSISFINKGGNVYHMVNDYNTLKIVPKQVMSWKQIIDNSGIPNHTKPFHYTLYKIKTLYGRLKDHIYYRVMTESAFGKDKYKESISILLDKCSILNDPTRPNLFFRACHHRDITVNELPAVKTGEEFSRFCNMLMRIGDGTNMLDNSARKTGGTKEIADTSMLSTSFTHNVPSYYHLKGMKGWYEIYPFNVYSRYFPTLYEGYLQANFPDNLDHEIIAGKYEDWLMDWIRSCLWYEKNWDHIRNTMNPNILQKYLDKFPDKLSRFKDHLKDMAKAFCEYSEGDELLYDRLLEAEYEAHKASYVMEKNEFVVKEEVVK